MKIHETTLISIFPIWTLALTVLIPAGVRKSKSSSMFRLWAINKESTRCFLEYWKTEIQTAQSCPNPRKSPHREDQLKNTKNSPEVRGKSLLTFLPSLVIRNNVWIEDLRVHQTPQKLHSIETPQVSNLELRKNIFEARIVTWDMKIRSRADVRDLTSQRANHLATPIQAQVAHIESGRIRSLLQNHSKLLSNQTSHRPLWASTIVQVVAKPGHENHWTMNALLQTNDNRRANILPENHFQTITHNYTNQPKRGIRLGFPGI